MPDILRSLIRTAVPAAWAALLVWLTSKVSLPADVVAVLDTVDDVVLIPAALAGLYAAFRWLESRRWMPRWLIRVLLGSATAPTYRPRNPDGSYTITDTPRYN